MSFFVHLTPNKHKQSKIIPLNTLEEDNMKNLILDDDFQDGILAIALKDDSFANKLVRFSDSLKKESGKEVLIFSTAPRRFVFEVINKSILKYKRSPSPGQIKQEIRDLVDELQSIYLKYANELKAKELKDEAYYRDRLSVFFQQIQTQISILKISEAWKGKKEEQIPDITREFISKVDLITMKDDSLVRLSEMLMTVDSTDAVTEKTIPTGLPNFDRATGGGLPVGLVTVVGPTNSGKSLFCMSLACQALRATSSVGAPLNLKVLHINLEGAKSQVLRRYIANLAGVETARIRRNELSYEERQRIKKTIKEIDDRLVILHKPGFDTTIEDLVAEVRDLHKQFKFDLINVDYGGLLRTRKSIKEERHIQAETHHGLDALAKEFDVPVITPVQANRGAQRDMEDAEKNKKRSPVIKSTDMAEAFEIARMSEIVITLNRTPEEAEQEKMRVFLDKQREGEKYITDGIITDFKTSNLITGKYYDPKESHIVEVPTTEKPTEMTIAKITAENDIEIIKRCGELLQELEMRNEEIRVLAARKESTVQEKNKYNELVDNREAIKKEIYNLYGKVVSNEEISKLIREDRGIKEDNPDFAYLSIIKQVEAMKQKESSDVKVN